MEIVKDKFIKINNGIGEFISEVYNPNNELIGIIKTETEFHDLRVQIKENNLSGYYLICRNHYGNDLDLVFEIDNNGRSYDWDGIYFEMSDNLMSKLL